MYPAKENGKVKWEGLMNRASINGYNISKCATSPI